MTPVNFRTDPKGTSPDISGTLTGMGVPEEDVESVVQVLESVDLPTFAKMMAHDYGLDDEQAKQVWHGFWGATGPTNTLGVNGDSPYFPTPMFSTAAPRRTPPPSPLKGVSQTMQFKIGDSVTTPTGTEALEIIKVNEATGRVVARDWLGKTQDYSVKDLVPVQSDAVGPASFGPAVGMTPPTEGPGMEIRKPYGARKGVTPGPQVPGAGVDSAAYPKKARGNEQLGRQTGPVGKLRWKNLSGPLGKYPTEDDDYEKGGFEATEREKMKVTLDDAPEAIMQSSFDIALGSALSVRFGAAAEKKFVKSFDAGLRNQFPQAWQKGLQDALQGQDNSNGVSTEERMAYLDGLYEGQSQKGGSETTGPVASPGSLTAARLAGRVRGQSVLAARERTIGDRLYDYVSLAKNRKDAQATESLGAFLGEHNLSEYLGENKSAFETASEIANKVNPDSIDLFLQTVEGGESYNAFDAEAAEGFGGPDLPDDMGMGPEEEPDLSLSEMEEAPPMEDDDLSLRDLEGGGDLPGEDDPMALPEDIEEPNLRQ